MSALLTVTELAAILKLTPGVIYRLAKSGRLPVHHIGGALRFDLDAVLAATRGGFDKPEVAASLSKFQQVRQRLHGSLKTDHTATPSPHQLKGAS